MDTLTKRRLLFLFGCIGSRCVLVYLAKYLPLHLLFIMGCFTLIPAFGFIFIYIFRLRQTGTEVFGDKIWWDDLRPIHGMLYLLFSYFAIQKNPFSWIFLAIDVVIGFISFLHFHYYKLQ